MSKSFRKPLSPRPRYNDMLVAYSQSWYRSYGLVISSRDEINKRFLEWCAEKKYRARPHDAFRGILEGAAQDARRKFDGKPVRVYWRSVPHSGEACRMDHLTLKSTLPPDVL